MPLPTFQKQPTEVRRYGLDFSKKLGSDTLTGTPTATVSLQSGGGSSSLTTSGASISNPLAYITLSGGTSGQDYNVQLSCSTTGGLTLVMDMSIEVREYSNG